MFRRYFLATLAMACTALVAVFAFNIVIDPYGYIPRTPLFNAAEAQRAGRANADRLIKPVDIYLRQPRILILGTSRVKQAMNPATLDVPTYNAGLDSGSLQEMRILLANAIRRDLQLETAFVEIFLSHFVFPSRREPDPSPASLTEWLDLPFRLYASSSATRLSIETFLAHSQSREIWGVAGADGYRAFKRTPANANGWIAPYFRAYIDKSPPVRLVEESFTEIDKIQESCRIHRIRCVFFVSPLSPVQLGTFDLDGVWPLIETVKHRLSHYPDIVDFALPNSPTWEVTPRLLTYWYDTNHFSSAAGRDMLLALHDYAVEGKITPDIMAVLTPAEVERQLAAWPVALARWHAANPGARSLFARSRQLAPSTSAGRDSGIRDGRQ